MANQMINNKLQIEDPWFTRLKSRAIFSCKHEHKDHDLCCLSIVKLEVMNNESIMCIICKPTIL